MKRVVLAAILIALAFLIVGCGPTVTVANKTNIPVRVIVRSSGRSEVLSPSPGESSSAEADEGVYTAAVIPDQEWIDYAKLVRKDLNEQLANSKNLSGPQVLDLIRRLKDIASKMQQFEQAANKGASCSGSIRGEGGAGLVQVNIGVDGALVVSCK